MRRRLLTLALLGALVLALVSGLQTGAQPRKIVIYSAIEEKVTTEIVKAFRARTGIESEVLSLAAAGTLATRIRAEKAKPRADVFMGGSADIHAPLAKEGLLLKYLPRTLAEAKIDKQFYDPDHYWHGWYLGALGILVNRERFEREIAPKGVSMPKTWDDLLNPVYKGHFAMPSPVTTGGGYIFVATQVFRLGEDRAFAWLKQLAANASQFTPTAPATVTLISRGEAIVAMMWAHEGFVARLMGFPVEVILPPDTGFEIGSASIIKGGPNPEGAKAFVDFLLTPLPQGINAAYGMRYPVRPDAASPVGAPPFASIKFVKYDRNWAIENRDRLIRRWQAEIGR